MIYYHLLLHKMLWGFLLAFVLLIILSIIRSELGKKDAIAVAIVFLMGLVCSSGQEILIRKLDNGYWENQNRDLSYAEVPETPQGRYGFAKIAEGNEGWRLDCFFQWQYVIGDPYDERVATVHEILAKNDKEVVIANGISFSLQEIEIQEVYVSSADPREYILWPPAFSGKGPRLIIIRPQEIK